MITCKLCGTGLDLRKTRRDGALLCPVCGQIYWGKAVEAAANRRTHLTEKRPILGRVR